MFIYYFSCVCIIGSYGTSPMAQAVSSDNMAAVELLVLKGAKGTIVIDVVMTYQHRLTNRYLLVLLVK